MALFNATDVNAQAKQGPAKKAPAKTATAKAAAKPAISAQDATEGKALLSKSDCLACHKEDTKLVGPAYLDVAKKYKATDDNIALLTTKVINGGAGNWGPVPMSPHATLAAADAKKMVQYILSLNK
ncbi:c-type cytochrome [Chitinophaga agrisoli]|uniref:C-type cytochrome n=2 Tax=Chitinophaga agrisoli TaxID=2607653 RepID=A0A5B2VRA0_9BACT|nr:c-type cytochrome [Chitinophaga agrisoli]